MLRLRRPMKYRRITTEFRELQGDYLDDDVRRGCKQPYRQHHGKHAGGTEQTGMLGHGVRRKEILRKL